MMTDSSQKTSSEASRSNSMSSASLLISTSTDSSQAPSRRSSIVESPDISHISSFISHSMNAGNVSEDLALKLGSLTDAQIDAALNSFWGWGKYKRRLNYLRTLLERVIPLIQARFQILQKYQETINSCCETMPKAQDQQCQEEQKQQLPVEPVQNFRIILDNARRRSLKIVKDAIQRNIHPGESSVDLGSVLKSLAEQLEGNLSQFSGFKKHKKQLYYLRVRIAKMLPLVQAGLHTLQQLENAMLYAQKRFNNFINDFNRMDDIEGFSSAIELIDIAIEKKDKIDNVYEAVFYRILLMRMKRSVRDFFDIDRWVHEGSSLIADIEKNICEISKALKAVDLENSSRKRLSSTLETARMNAYELGRQHRCLEDKSAQVYHLVTGSASFDNESATRSDFIYTSASHTFTLMKEQAQSIIALVRATGLCVEERNVLRIDGSSLPLQLARAQQQLDDGLQQKQAFNREGVSAPLLLFKSRLLPIASSSSLELPAFPSVPKDLPFFIPANAPRVLPPFLLN